MRLAKAALVTPAPQVCGVGSEPKWPPMATIREPSTNRLSTARTRRSSPPSFNDTDWPRTPGSIVASGPAGGTAAAWTTIRTGPDPAAEIASPDESSPMSAAQTVMPSSIALNRSRRSRSRATATTCTPALRRRQTIEAPSSPVAPTTTACCCSIVLTMTSPSFFPNSQRGVARSVHGKAAVDRQVMACGESGLLACQEGHCLGHLVGAHKATHRVRRAAVTYLFGGQLPGHLCLSDRGGRDEVRGDSVWRQFEGDVADKLVQCRLGGAKRDHAFARTSRQSRAEVHQPTVVAGDHLRHNGFGDQKCGTQFTVQFAAELLPTQIGERSDVKRNQSVVYEHIDPAPPLFDLADHRDHIVSLCDVRPNCQRLAVCRGRGADHLICLLGARTVVDDYPKPLLCEHQGGGCANTPAAAGDQGNTIHLHPSQKNTVAVGRWPVCSDSQCSPSN